MAAFNFPNSPSTNDLHTENGVTYKWNGTVWKRQNASYTDATNLNVTGISTVGSITGVAATFTGNVQIGGVLTYEDVKNVDSVGIVTARTGIHIDDSITHIGDTDTKIRFPAADTITAETGGSERLRITGGGKVGIGTEIPSELLEIASSVGCGIAIKDDNNGFAASKIKVENGGRDLSIGAPQDIFFKDIDTGTKHLYIESTGHIGIGTDNPTQKLDIRDGNILLDAFNNSGDGGIFFRPGFTVADSNSYNLSILAYDHSGVNKDGLSLNAYDGISFCTGSNTRDEKVRITSAGSVGIGSASPAGMLEVQKNGVPAIISNYNHSKHISMSVGGSGGGWAQTTGNHFAWTHQPYADRGTDNNLSEKMRITPGGFLGIGAGANTNKPLHIYTGAADSEIRLQTNSGTEQNSYISLRQATGDLDLFTVVAGTKMKFFTANSERIRITGTGQFHMGGGSSWTYASQKFVVVEPNNALGMLLQGNNSNEGVNLTLQNIVNANNAYSSLSFADDGGQIFGIVRGKVNDKNANTGELQFWTSGSQKLTIDKDGNVGIGEASPGSNNEKLTVREDIAAASGKAIISIFNLYQGTSGQANQSTGALEFTFKNHNASHNWWGGRISCFNTDNYNQYTYLRFDTASAGNASGKMWLTHDGKLGMGQQSPDGKLHAWSATAGSVSADADADELVLENSGNVGLSLLTAGTGESSIYFGNPGTGGQKDGYIKY